jgi:hypothetical protein
MRNTESIEDGGVLGVENEVDPIKRVEMESIQVYNDVLSGEIEDFPHNFWGYGLFDKDEMAYKDPVYDARVRAIIRYAALELSNFPLDYGIHRNLKRTWFKEMKLDGALYSLGRQITTAYRFAFKEEIENDFYYEGIFPHRMGLDRIFDFLEGEIDFEDLKPFKADMNAYKTYSQNVFTFYLGKGEEGSKNLSFSVGEDLDVAEAYVFPKSEENKGKNPYYWLEFYEEVPGQDSPDGEPFSSVRLLPELGKTESRIWKGLGEQLLTDYLHGKNGLSFDDLVPFTIHLSSPTAYAFSADRSINIYFEQDDIKTGTTLKIIPRKDDVGVYEWIEIYIDNEEDQNEYSKFISSYRMTPDQQMKLSSREWYGPERQLLFDFLNDRRDVAFEDLKPIRVRVANKRNAVNLLPQVSINIKEDVRGDIIFIPRQDEEKSYQWFDVYKIDDGSGLVEENAFTSVRLQDGKFVQKGWYGYEKQLLRDYLNGEKTFDDLRPINLIKRKSDVLSLWKEEGRKVYIALSKNFGVQDGDQLELVPVAESGQSVEFAILQNGVELGYYNFDVTERKFYLKSINSSIKNPEIIFDESSGAYINSSGERFVTIMEIVRRFNMSYQKTSQLTKHLAFISAQFKSGNRYGVGEFYREVDVLETLENSGYLDKLNSRMEVKKQKGYWTPERIESEASAFLKEFGILDNPSLLSQGRRDLVGAIQSHYPGKLTSLREFLGIPRKQKLEPPIRRRTTRWSELKEKPEELQSYIRARVKDHLDSGGSLTVKSFKEAGLTNLLIGITRYYPGSLKALKIEFFGADHSPKLKGSDIKKQIRVRSDRKSVNEWTIEGIEEEALNFFQQNGSFNTKVLLEFGRGDLRQAIKRYPGGMFALQEKLGIQSKKKPIGYWTPERIEEEAEDFYKKYGVLSQAKLVAKDRNDLLGAIAKYHGMLTGLKKKLGISSGPNVKESTSQILNSDNLLIDLLEVEE